MSGINFNILSADECVPDVTDISISSSSSGGSNKGSTRGCGGKRSRDNSTRDNLNENKATTTSQKAGNTVDRTVAKVLSNSQVLQEMKDKPKRPLSAYNLFFRLERDRLLNTPNNVYRNIHLVVKSDPDHESNITREVVNLIAVTRRYTNGTKRQHRKTHGLIGFNELTRLISEKWKRLSNLTKQLFEERAVEEKMKYVQEMRKFKSVMKKKRQNQVPMSCSSNVGDPANTIPTESNPTRVAKAALPNVSTSNSSINIARSVSHGCLAEDWSSDRSKLNEVDPSQKIIPMVTKSTSQIVNRATNEINNSSANENNSFNNDPRFYQKPYSMGMNGEKQREVFQCYNNLDETHLNDDLPDSNVFNGNLKSTTYNGLSAVTALQYRSLELLRRRERQERLMISANMNRRRYLYNQKQLQLQQQLSIGTNQHCDPHLSFHHLHNRKVMNMSRMRAGDIFMSSPSTSYASRMQRRHSYDGVTIPSVVSSLPLEFMSEYGREEKFQNEPHTPSVSTRDNDNANIQYGNRNEPTDNGATTMTENCSHINTTPSDITEPADATVSSASCSGGVTGDSEEGRTEDKSLLTSTDEYNDHYYPSASDQASLNEAFYELETRPYLNAALDDSDEAFAMAQNSFGFKNHPDISSAEGRCRADETECNENSYSHFEDGSDMMRLMDDGNDLYEPADMDPTALPNKFLFSPDGDEDDGALQLLRDMKSQQCYSFPLHHQNSSSMTMQFSPWALQSEELNFLGTPPPKRRHSTTGCTSSVMITPVNNRNGFPHINNINQNNDTINSSTDVFDNDRACKKSKLHHDLDDTMTRDDTDESMILPNETFHHSFFA